MEGVLFTESAFRHGFRREDFFGVLAGDYLKVRSQRGLDDVYELLGRNLTGQHLHVIYRRLAGGQIRVFHMSRMTDAQRRRFRRARG
jgi:hypothetical protein